MTNPRRPAHADYTFPTSNPRLTGKRHLFDYAYAANGNVHNPTPHYLWLLLLDGEKVVDTFHRQRDLKVAVTEYDYVPCDCMPEPDEHGVEEVLTHSLTCQLHPEYGYDTADRVSRNS